MKHTKTILLMIWISSLVACTTVGNTGSVGQSSATKLASKSAQVKQGVMREISAGETDVAVASPLEAPKTYEAESPTTVTPTPVVINTMPSKAITPSSVHINAQQGLILNMRYPQAWNRTGKALSQAGYPVMEQDSTSGTYYILDKIGTGGVIKRDTPIYQLHLQKNGDNKTTVTLNNAQNQVADDAVVQRILGALKNKLGA